jgi:hypothetical protein
MSAEIDRGSYPKSVLRLFVQLITGLVAATLVAVLALAPAAVLAGEPSAVTDVPGAWFSQAQQSIAREEYEVTWQTETTLADLDAAWQAPNRSHGLRTYFTPQGIRVVPRQDAAPWWEWGLAWVGYGRGGMSWAVPAARLAPSGARIDYQRGGLSEWYENSPRGLKQGFVLDAPPEQWGRSGEGEPEALGTVVPGRGRRMAAERLVHVDLALTGSLRPVVSEDGLAIDFEAPGGARVVHFAGLAVTDARGKPLAAWMEGYAGTRGGGIRIVIDDADAVYPITVDPLATSPSWTAESDQAAANFGVAVAPAGDVNGDGYADVIVGADGYDNGQADEGRAFVYHGSPAGLATTAAWAAESNQAGALFGAAVATAGDVNGDGYSDVIVGARNYDNGQTDEGRAYVYLGSAAGLNTPAWTAESDQASSSFGISVGAAGDVNGDGYSDVIVGARWYDNGQSDEGRAYVYHGSAAGLAATAAWTAESNQASAYFGQSVATAGDVNGDGYGDVIVGADYADYGQTDEGRAYVYFGSAAGLGGTAAWTAESDQAGAYFGHSVATAGDVNGDGFADVIVGAYSYDGGQTDEGRAFVFLGSAAGPATTAAWTAESDQAYSWFGFLVGTAGDVNGDGYADVIVGAHLYDNGQTDEGRAFVYFGSAAGLAATAAWTAEGDQADAILGYAAATAGDVNGDGYADVIVGTRNYDNGQTDEGRAYVYLGSAAGPAATAGWTTEGGQVAAWLGYSVATAGDVNGDGYADVIVGAPNYDNGQTEEGRAMVFLGSAAGLAATAGWTAESDQVGAYFGSSVSTAGDVNGDGYADVIVGARLHDNGQTEEGRAFVYHGSPAGLATAAAWTAESDQAGAYFGYSVATAGDVNGDGYADVIVGAYVYDNGQVDEGRAYVYLGSAAGLSATAAWTAESDQASALFGNTVSTAGDVNGDGYADVIVGAYLYDNGQVDEGRAYVYLGSAASLAAAAAWTAESDQAGAYLGISVGTAGDVNGDGYADVIVGAHNYDNGQTDEGRALVYLGSAAGLAATAAWTAESDQASAYFGHSVATAGDVNGDGYADVIVGAFLYDNEQASEGHAYVYYGNAGPGLSLRPQQRRADDTTPIAQGGRSHTPGQFRLASLGRGPFGRTRTRLEWEVKPFGQLLDGTGTSRSAGWSDTGTAGASFSELVSGFEPGRYHWRVRLLYDPVRSPFAHKGRWFAVPWGGQEEADLFLASLIGGVVWNDRDGDGIREPGEPGMARLKVSLLSASGSVVTSTFTDNAGGYRFEIDPSTIYRVRFTLPSGYLYTLRDQGANDALDSDADPETGETVLIAPPHYGADIDGWSGGMLVEGPCFAPDEPVYISRVRLDANNLVVLDLQDPNQTNQVTGYNVYRSSSPAAPWPWPLVGSNVRDMDAGTANIQWVDQSGDPGTWFYQVNAYNAVCDTEGPR